MVEKGGRMAFFVLREDRIPLAVLPSAVPDGRHKARGSRSDIRRENPPLGGQDFEAGLTPAIPGGWQFEKGNLSS